MHVLVLLAFAALLAAPLTAPGYFMFAHDARHTVYFMQMFDAALRDGALYPRWATDMVFGYGYPVWLILAPLPYYIAEGFHLLGFDFPSAVKALDGFSLIVSGLSMYLFASRVLGRDGGLVAAVAYLYVPYHIVDLYVRGAAPEFLAFVFPPLILWALHQLWMTRRKVFVPLAALAYGGMVLSHVQMAVLFSPVIAGYVLVLWLNARRESGNGAVGGQEPQAIIRGGGLQPAPASQPQGGQSNRVAAALLAHSALAVVWGIGIAAAFLLPVIAEQRYLTSDPLIGGFFDFRLHFVNPSQLLSPFWGYGYAGIHGADQFSLQLGVMPLFFAGAALFTLKAQDGASRQLIYFALVTLTAVFLMLSVSAPLWELAAGLVAFVQFPWRMLFITAFALAFMAGASVRAVAATDSFIAALLFSLVLALAMFPFARPEHTEAQFTWNAMMDFQVKDRELLGDTIWTKKRPETSPLVAQYRAGKITEKAVIVEGGGSVELLERRPLGDTVRVSATSPVRLMFYTRYFPGWYAVVNGEPTAIEPFGEQGLIAVNLPPGVHTVTTRFGDTLPRQAGALITVVSILAAVVWLFKSYRQTLL